MYIDRDMKLEFYIPKNLRDYLDMAEKSYDENADNRFDVD